MESATAAIRRRRPGCRPVNANQQALPTESALTLSETDKTTPIKLRELERGWRARRRLALQELSHNAQENPQKIGLIPSPTKSFKQARPTTASQETLRAFNAVAGSRRPGSHNDMPTTRRVNWDGAAQGRATTVAMDRSDFRARVTGTRRRSATIPPTPPPSPPPSLIGDRGRLTRDSALSTLVVYRPILAAPLPPTPSPVRLLRQSGDTITVHLAGYKYELGLSLDSGKKTVQVLAGGEVVYWQSGTNRHTSLSLRDEARWGAAERSKWQAIQDLVNRFKRKTPRVKIYHSLGQLSITCSDPPDVILDLTLSDRSSSAPTVASAPSQTRVKLVYSRHEKSLTFDSESVCQTQPASKVQTERLRAKRVVQLAETLHPQHVTPGNAWSIGEVEALRRLCVLTHEWERY